MYNPQGGEKPSSPSPHILQTSGHNKNLFLAYVAAFITAAITAQLFSKSISYLDTSVTMVAENSAYFGIFGLLHSIDHRKKCRIKEIGRLDWLRLRTDLISF